MEKNPAHPSGPVSPEIGVPPRTEDNRRDVLRGMILMVGAMLILPMMDGIAKLLSTQYDVSPGQITLGRFVVQAALLGPIILVFFGARALIPKYVWVNLARGAMMACAVLMFFVTLRYMPIADAIAVFFVEPFILTILSIFLLGEKVGWRRIAAVIVGFGGALLIVQPSYELFGPVSLLPLGTALLFALYLITTRKFAADDDPLAMQLVSGIGGAVTLLAIGLIGNHFSIEDIATPGLPEFGVRWLLIFTIGALAAIGHLVVVYAFRLASASILAPFQYVEIVGATVLGYWLFGDFPDALKWVGIFIIIGSGLYIFFRERQDAGPQGH